MSDTQWIIAANAEIFIHNLLSARGNVFGLQCIDEFKQMSNVLFNICLCLLSLL